VKRVYARYRVAASPTLNICTDSHVVLQQTRVSTVIPYFNNWISKWPTVQDLAKADHDDVLAAWKGLGYYSRATRLHEGAKAMVAKYANSACLLPSKAVDLQEFPGIGKYTAGAVSSIAFGEPEPVLDGNVARVLSRQLGLYMNPKDKKTSDVLWEEADRLIKHVSSVSGTSLSAIPGQWNQALMELGSTVCTPQPQCAECPIQTTCRVYSEGQALSTKQRLPPMMVDIEDACILCESLDTEEMATPLEDADEMVISHYFAASTIKDSSDEGNSSQTPQHDNTKKRKATVAGVAQASNLKATTTYCSLFPKRAAKKKAAEEECVVCVVESRPSTGESKWLIEQRPAKGKNYKLIVFVSSLISVCRTARFIVVRTMQNSMTCTTSTCYRLLAG
jgi:A/G-specific adenine glycosylase